MTDWAEPSIKLQSLHKRLDECLNDKKHSEAFSLILEMQGEVLKLQQYVIGHNAEIRGRAAAPLEWRVRREQAKIKD